MRRAAGAYSEAVVFFDGERIVKEMLFMEFEAVLDQVVGLNDFAGREIQAVFLRINPHLWITGAVFFLIEFNPDGHVSRDWNIPLRHLLDTAGRGPDLGAGSIRLSCRSQCSIAWHQRQLWDPRIEGSDNSFNRLRQAIKRNRLGLSAQPEDEPPVLKAAAQSLDIRYQHELQERMAQVRQEFELRVANYRAEWEQHVQRLQRYHEDQQQQVRDSLDAATSLLKDEKQRNQRLKARLEEQAADLTREREGLEARLSQARDVEQGRLDELHRQFERELQARLDSASVELQEKLDMRDMEIMYRDEQLNSLREEITQLRHEKDSLLAQSGNRLLEQLAASGITFVAYQPGLDHLTVPLSDIPRYLDSPQHYAAEQCRVSLGQYEQWLRHFELPVCQAQNASGGICGEPIRKVSKPGQFVPGDSDRCNQHSALNKALGTMLRAREGL